MCLIYRLYRNKTYWLKTKQMNRQKQITLGFTYGFCQLPFQNDKPGLIPGPVCFLPSMSIIAPPQTTIIKRNHSKNCDISHLCIELVVKEMSQQDV